MTENPTSFHSVSFKIYLGQDPKNTTDCSASLDQNDNKYLVTVPDNASKREGEFIKNFSHRLKFRFYLDSLKISR